MKRPAACRDLKDVRAAVNALDRDLIKLLARRHQYALAALRFKRDRKDVGDPRHRRAMFGQRKMWAQSAKVNPRMTQKFFRAIVNESKRLHVAGLRARKR